ncbi:MAG: sigma-70 family RNA polymerase sigma factor [Candidatus Hydrogenedentes bacterium]|nr:sigma-70 family RNA polymerase sigma factor [Candidatus Hydrogenedentota bacterium]
MLIHLQMVSDGRIVRRVLGGRRDDFGVLVRRYYGAVHSVARARLENPADIEDVAQEAFVNAWRRLDTLNTPNRFGPWLMSIARNAAVSWGRHRRAEVLMADAGDLPDRGVEPRVERNELQGIVREKLLEMDPEQREILMLYYYEGKGVGEIAVLLEITRAAAGKRLQRAREALGNEFLKAVGEPPQADSRKRACRAVMAAVAATPVVWQAKAAAAGSAALVLVKIVVAALTLTAVGTGAVVAVKHVQSGPAATTTVQKSAEQVAQVSPPESAPVEAAQPVPAEKAEPEQTGPGKMASLLLNNETEQPVGNAEVTAELINWGPLEMPPAATFKKMVRADSAGKFVFENMPLGAYCVAAVTPAFCGADDFTVESADRTYAPARIPMYPRASIKGRLLGADGGPVAGVVIYPIEHILFPGEEIDHAMIASVRAVTAADGVFSFPAILPGAWKFYIRADGLPPVITDFKVLEDEMVLNLEAPGSMAGRLVDAATGEPRSGITLQVHQGRSTNIANPSPPGDRAFVPGYRVMAEAISGADGTFRLPNLAPGKYKIDLADAALLNALPDEEFEVHPGAETSVEVRAALSASILGRVYNRETGSGLAGYSVLLPSYKQTSTDANGEYAFMGVKPGTYRLEVGTPVATGGFTGSYWDLSNQVTATVTYGQVLEHVDIAMATPKELAGHVVDRHGQPVAGATVKAFGRDTYSQAFTDEAGRFSFNKNLLSLQHLTLFAKKDDWQCEMMTDVDPSEEILLTLNVPAGGAIHGMAFSADGKPLVLHQVSAVLETEEPLFFVPTNWAGKDGRTGSNGEFVLENLAAGTYQVEARRLGDGAGTPAASARVSLGKNEILRNVRLRPEPQGQLSISGRVTTSDGGQLYGASVEIPGVQSSRIAADGRFTLKGLTEGEHMLSFSSSGYSPAVVDKVAAGTTNVSVTLYPPAVLAGTVTDAATGQPVKAFQLHCSTQVTLNLSTDTALNYVDRSFSSEAGAFRIDNVSALPVWLVVRADGYAPQEQHVTLKGGEVNEVDFDLEPGAPVSGKVVDTAGNPIPGAEIVAQGRNPTPITDSVVARTDENGAFLIDTLPEATAQMLIASHQAYAPACVEVTPRRGQQTSVTFVLERPGTLEVHVLLDGQPMRPCYVRSNDACFLHSFFSLEQDVWVNRNLPPGEMQFTVALCSDNEGAPSPSQTLTATIVSGQTTVVEAQFDTREQEETPPPA